MKKILSIYLFIVGVLFLVGVAFRGQQVMAPALQTIVGIIIAEVVVALASIAVAHLFFHDPYPGTSGSLGVLIIRAAVSLVIWPVGVFAVMLGSPIWTAIIVCAVVMAVLNLTYILLCLNFGRAPRDSFDYGDDGKE